MTHAAAPRRPGLRPWILALAFATSPALLFADNIVLTFNSVPGGAPIVGAGTNVAILNFGTVSAFGPLGSGVSRTISASDYTISTQFGVRVVRNGNSPNYTLQARLQLAHSLAWQLNGVTMTTSPTTVATLQPYGTTLPHTLAFVVPFSFAAGLVNTGFEVTAIAN
jgi:hypothetical protein